MENPNDLPDVTLENYPITHPGWGLLLFDLLFLERSDEETEGEELVGERFDGLG